jgi:endonuclease/exonuclease/phosphatase family metal-dependent hydrolase
MSPRSLQSSLSHSMVLTLLFMLVVAVESDSLLFGAVSFNVLAPLWSDPNLYPSQCHAVLKNRTLRVQKASSYLNAQETDLVALQETQTDTNVLFESLLRGSFSMFAVSHDDSYWHNYETPNQPSTLPLSCLSTQGVQPCVHTGVAVLVNRTRFSDCLWLDLPLSTHGNHAAVAACQLRAPESGWVRFVSCHLDSDTGGRRGHQMDALLEFLETDKRKKWLTTIVAGDLNADTEVEVLKSRLSEFSDTLVVAGLQGLPTHPWTSCYNRNSLWAAIDHIIVNKTDLLSVQQATIRNYDLYSLYPPVTGMKGQENEEIRICVNFDRCGR